MADEQRARRVWITYAWADNNDGDFDFLVQELEAAGVEAAYDRVKLVPGFRLWDQIGERIAEDPIDGWAILATESSLTSQPCREELSYAVGRALKTKGGDFPLMALVPRGVPFDSLPPALRNRLCISLATEGWTEHVKAGLERRAPQTAPPAVTRYVWDVHERYVAFQGSPPRIAIEVRPRFGQIEYWRFVMPKGTRVVHCGHARSGGSRLSTVNHYIFEPNGENDGVFTAGPLADAEFDWCGAGDSLSPSTSAYIVFDGAPPAWIGFAPATDLWGGPDAAKIEVKKLSGG